MNIRDIVITFLIVVVLLAVFSFFAIKTVNEKFSMLVQEINILKRQLQEMKNSKYDQCKIPNKTKNQTPPKSDIKENMISDINKDIDFESDNTANEVAQLEKELGDINELLGDSVSSLDGELGQDLLRQYEKNLQNTNLEEINSGIVDIVNNIANQDDIENQNLSESNSYKKNNLSELDELAYVDPERNSELNELIKQNLENNINNENSQNVEDIQNTQTVPDIDNTQNSLDIENDQINKGRTSPLKPESEVYSSNVELSLSDEPNTEYNIEEKNTLKEEVQLDLLAREYLQKDLKDICKNFNLSMKGNKRKLIERIATAGHIQEVYAKDKILNVT